MKYRFVFLLLNFYFWGELKNIYFYSGEKVLVREMTRLQTVVQDREETIQQLRYILLDSGTR